VQVRLEKKLSYRHLAPHSQYLIHGFQESNVSKTGGVILVSLCRISLPCFQASPKKLSSQANHDAKAFTEEAERQRCWRPPSPKTNGPCRKSRQQAGSSCDPRREDQCVGQSCRLQGQSGGGRRESVFCTMQSVNYTRMEASEGEKRKQREKVSRLNIQCTRGSSSSGQACQSRPCRCSS
jgi:hypothetical protein